MGRTTYESVGDLPGRHVFSVSRRDPTPKLIWLPNGGVGFSDQVFIAGGKKLIASAFESGETPDCLIISTIERECPHAEIKLTDDDLHLDQYFLYSARKFGTFTIRVYVKNPHEPRVPSGVHEYVPPHDVLYERFVRGIVDNGTERDDRTGKGTISVFAPDPLRFDVSELLPLLTTKKVFLRGVIEELCWFLRGSTDSNELERVGVNIWKQNTTREFLDGRKLFENKVGDAGPIYGKQWRDFSGEDQLRNLISGIVENPASRRHVVSAWNAGELPLMALPPCHVLFQVYARENVLDLHLYMRSCDVGLGLPFNIASYALLLHIISKHTHRTPGELIISFGDAHVYSDHVEPLLESLDRHPKAGVRVLNVENNALEEYNCDSFEFSDYFSHPAVRMEMAI